MSDEATAKPKRARRERVYRKGPGRGWVYRWKEWDRAAGKVVKRTSVEHEKKGDAQAAERVERNRRTVEKLLAKKQRRSGGAQPLALVLERWEASRIATRRAGPAWCEEVKRTLTKLAAARGWRTVVDITADDVDQWISAAKGVGVERPLDMVKSVLTYAHRTMRQPVDADVLLMGVRAAGAGKSRPYRFDDVQLATILGRCDAFGESVGTLARHTLLLGQRPITTVNIEVGDWDEVNRLLAASRNKNGEPLLVAVLDDDLAQRLSRLTRGRARREKLYLHPDGTPWSGKHGSSGKLTTWWPRNIAADFRRGLRGIYILVDTAVSRMREAGWEAAAIAATTGKRTKAVHDLYDATNRERQRALWRRLPVLPAPVSAEVARGREWADDVAHAWGPIGGPLAPGAAVGDEKSLRPSL